MLNMRVTDRGGRKEADYRAVPKSVKTTTRIVPPATAAGVLLKAVRQK
jgi:hypothetical protein